MHGICAEYSLGGPSNIRPVLRCHFGDQDLNRLLLHAFDGICVPGLDVDAPNLHRRLGHRRNRSTHPRLHLLPAVQWQHPGNWTEQYQAKMPTTFQRGRWLQRVAHSLRLPFVRGADRDALARANESLDQTSRVHSRHRWFGQRWPFGRESV